MPFTDLYSLLKRAQGQIGGLGGAGGAVLGGGNPYGTPPFVPQQQSVGDPALGGIDPGVDPSAAAPQSGFTGLLRSPQFQAFGASLLANSGYQPGKGITGGQALGEALMAGQQAKRQSLNDQLQQELLRAKISETKAQATGGGQDPALVAEFKFAQANGFTGSFPEYIRSKNRSDDGIGNFNPGDYTPESLQAYLGSRTSEKPMGDVSLLKRYVSPAQPSVQVVNGVPTVVQGSRTGGAPTQQPLTTLPETVDAGRQIKSGEAQGAATGKATGEAQGEIAKKGQQAAGVKALLDIAEPLLDVSTGSGAGAAADKVAGFFGFAPNGAVASGQLQVLGATLIQNMPRLEGPQSDRDTALYREASGQLSDPSIPIEVKKAAIKTIRDIQNRYQTAFAAQQGGQAPPAGAAPAGKRPPLSSFRKQ